MNTPKPILVTPIPSRTLSSPSRKIVSRTSRPRFRSAGAALASLCLLGLLLATATASAHIAYTPAGSFGATGAGAGGLEDPQAVAVNNETHNVYVADTGNHRVDEFTAAGAFVLAFGREINASVLVSNRNVCMAGETCQAGIVGSEPGQFESPSFVAVDNSTGESHGDVYVADSGTGTVQKFTGAGELVASWGEGGEIHNGVVATGTGDLTANSTEVTEFEASTGTFQEFDEISAGADIPAGTHIAGTGERMLTLSAAATAGGTKVALTASEPFHGVAGVAADTSGNLWVHALDGEEFEFAPAGGTLRHWATTGAAAPGTAVDGNENVYAFNGGGSVTKFTETGEELDSQVTLSVGRGGPPPTGLAADQASSNDLYVDFGGSVERIASPCQHVVNNANEATCAVSETFGSSTLSGGAGLAVDSSSGVVYVAEPGTGRVLSFAPEVVAVPTVEAESMLKATSSSASFAASVDPNGPATTYRFEYDTTPYLEGQPGHGESVPVGDGVVGSGFAGQEVSDHVQDLVGHTTYYYRVAATNEKGTTYGKDQSFTTQRPGGALTLPDGRQWELVTPPNKHGALVYGYTFEHPLQAAADGSGITNLLSQPPELEPSGSARAVQVLSTRGAGGWSTQVIALPHKEGSGLSVGAGEEFQFFSEDLSRAIVHPFGENFDPLLSPEASEQTAYLRDDTTGTYRPLVTGCPASGECPASVAEHANVPPGLVFGHFSTGSTDACPPAIDCGPAFVAGNPDLSHVILSSEVQLTATAPAGEEYEWSDGRLEPLQGSLPDAGGKNQNLAEFSRHTISSDGERLILNAEGLELRNGAGGEMIRLDLANADAAGVSAGARYQTASSDDSRIFFLDNTGLTAESSASGLDLYEYDLNAPAGERLTDLSVGHNTGEAAGVQTVLGASEDGSYVYFAASGALTADTPHGRCPVETINQNYTFPCNVYVYHDGTTRLIATDWYGENRVGEDPEFVRVSPDGRWLSFMSNQDLTGYDTRDSGNGQPDQEVYLYSADTNRLACASCNPTGSRPVGVSGQFLGSEELTGKPSTAAYVPGWTATSGSQVRYQPRYLSDGGRVFFNSRDALVPQDINNAWDVYEYEAAGYVNGEGAQECTEALSTYEPAHTFETEGRKGESGAGCVSLISSGTSHEESAFLDASATGGDVFFLTSEKLLRQDYDNAYDVYDAHECTATVPCFPASASQLPACETEASCKASPTPQPEIFGAPASATFSGKGNIASAPAAKAIVKPKALTRAQKLAKALRTCRKKAKGKARSSCEKQARAKYGSVKGSRKKAKKSSNDRRASR